MSGRLLEGDDGFILARGMRAAGRASALEAAVEAGEIERVRRGVYAVPLHHDPAFQQKSRPEQAAMTYRRGVAAAAQTLQVPVFTSFSAIALQRLPIVGSWPEDVIVLSPDRHGHRRLGVISVGRSAGDSPALEFIDGFQVTSIEYSLIQVCRHGSLAAALTAIDAALQATPASRNPPLTTLDRLWAEHRMMGRYTGSRKTLAALQRASSLSDTPLETCSRLVIEEWGFPAPTQQQAIWLPELGRNAYLDFYWEEYGIGAEADGNGKYLGNEGATASASIVVREKERENGLRRRLRGFDRWDWSEMWARRPVRDRLVAAGLPQVRRPMRLL
ncbi:type IV toxin-antitoxin system AbiEi family antitoxin domain-containing protein [Agromyces salentinus]|uniref:Transcriptional regulator, AbiEi antitoxin, Type IV TA system n=1 Tax=Agromyces salentinus TaxID=269421 RepID=A0ABN2MTW3_9MICO|nr:type IV toxin-antitoxin system AbiEi family antitoxin domain-containing protein [Agromyces salentinus]